jgi:hypothetical protein
LSTKDNSDSDSDSDSVDFILLTYKTLLTHPQGMYRGDLTPNGHRYGFGTMYYTIEPWRDDIHIGHWNEDKFRRYGTYIYSTGGSYIFDWLNCDMSGKKLYTFWYYLSW